jgi:hypothetical protein
MYVVAMAGGSEEARALDQDRNIHVAVGLDHTSPVKHDWCDRDNRCPGHNLGMPWELSYADVDHR